MKAGAAECSVPRDRTRDAGWPSRRGTGYTTSAGARRRTDRCRYEHMIPWFLTVRGGAVAERLQKPVMTTHPSDRPFDDPFPPEVTALDVVVIVLFYHDTVWLNADRDRMNRAVFAALKPEGIYLVIDHSSWPGRGTSEASTLHRIEEKVVRSEIERAGFKRRTGLLLRNPDDTRDWKRVPARGRQRSGPRSLLLSHQDGCRRSQASPRRRPEFVNEVCQPKVRVAR